MPRIRGHEPRRIPAAGDDPNRPDGPLAACFNVRRHIALAECSVGAADGAHCEYDGAAAEAETLRVAHLTKALLHPGKESPMAETKTRPTGASIDEYLSSRASPEQLTDCKALMRMCKRVTKQQPKMWGPSIVGYGSYTYRYESGHSGQSCLVGFAVRGRELVVYLVADGAEQAERLARLGKHRMTGSCLYFKRLADLDAKVLEELIAESVAGVKRRYPANGDA